MAQPGNKVSTRGWPGSPLTPTHQEEVVFEEELKLEHGSKCDEQQREHHSGQHLHCHPGQPEGCRAIGRGKGNGRMWAGSWLGNAGVSRVEGRPGKARQAWADGWLSPAQAMEKAGSMPAITPGLGHVRIRLTARQQHHAPDSSMPIVLSAWRSPRSRSDTTELSCELGSRGQDQVGWAGSIKAPRERHLD